MQVCSGGHANNVYCCYYSAYWLFFVNSRDTPSERLGNLKNGVKDIQKHKYVYGFVLYTVANGSVYIANYSCYCV